MTPLENLLNRLDGLRKGHDGWVAKCPAHDDKSPSLSITERDDGAVLLHCFSGCSAASVLDAVGLSLADLFPEPLHASLPSRPWKHNPGDLIRLLHDEAWVISLAATMVISGEVLSEADFNRLTESMRKIENVRAAL